MSELFERILCTQEFAVENYDFLGGRCCALSAMKPHGEVNEDSCAVYEISKTHGVIIVADGLGGHKSGDKASELVVKTIISEVKKSQSSKEVRENILSGIEEAHKKIKALGVGAGSTVAVAEINKDQLRFYSCGDSICALIGGQGTVKYKCIEHSPVGYSVEAGVLTAKEALNHSESHYLSFALGLDDMRVEVSCLLTLSPRDRVLISSDGLSSNIITSEVAQIINKEPLEEKVNQLGDMARQRMVQNGEITNSADDLTIVVFKS